MVLIDGGPEGMQWFKREDKKEKDMSERITAEEARKKSTTIAGEQVKKQLDLCEDAIQKAIKKNELHATVSLRLENLAEKDLINRGFSVKYTESDFRDPRDHGYTTISW